MQDNQKSIAILGPGGIGGFLAAVFWKAGFPVTCVAKPERADAITRDGIHLESAMFGEFTAHPRAVAALDSAPALLFITTKATGLGDALKRIDPGKTKGTLVIPLLNGIEHIGLLRNLFPNQVIAGTISIEAYEVSPGNIVHTTPFARIRLAADDPHLKERTLKAATMIAKTGITTEIGKREGEILWEKLVRLNALALTTTRYNKPIGELRSNETIRRELIALVNEAVVVAEKEGVVIDPEDVMTQIDRLNPHQSSSLTRDIDAGKESELDAIAGAIIRAGVRHGILCPTIMRCIAQIEIHARTN